MLKILQNNKFANILIIIIGLFLVIWGLSFFIVPVSSIIIGGLLIRYGLILNNFPIHNINIYWKNFTNFR